MNTWNQKFYAKKEVYESDIFRIPHPDLPLFIGYLKEKSGKTILDIGCGTGRHIITLAREVFDVYGIDIAEKALETVKERLEQENLTAHLYQGSIFEPLPYPEKFFDGVLSIKALHHGTEEQIKALIREIKRVMKVGGILMIEVPRRKGDRKADPTRHKEIEPGTIIPLEGPEAGVPHHIFDENELRKWFSDFEVLDLHATGENNIQTPSPHYTLIARLKK